MSSIAGGLEHKQNPCVGFAKESSPNANLQLHYAPRARWRVGWRDRWRPGLRVRSV